MVITLTTTAAQDAILDRLRVDTNVDRAAQQLAPLADVPALVTYVLTNAVLSYRQQQLASDAAAIEAIYVNGTNAQRNAIKTAAGL
jgi:hypothetical protein